MNNIRKVTIRNTQFGNYAKVTTRKLEKKYCAVDLEGNAQLDDLKDRASEAIKATAALHEKELLAKDQAFLAAAGA